jgi:KipI family sensor histidine kinase inhibitor
LDEYQIYPAGDSAVNVTFANRVDPKINRSIRQLQSSLEDSQLAGITGFVPAFRTLTILYDPLKLSLAKLEQAIESATLEVHQQSNQNMRIVHIPVAYGNEFGPDLMTVAKQAQLTPKQVISRHCHTDYLIYMLGFLPGFVYLGGLDSQIATPRLATPRLKIHAGAVGIAGEQTGIYPIESPGGWQIIGQTPLRLFRPDQPDPFYYHAGDYIHFDQISPFEYQQIKKLVNKKKYQIYVETRQVSVDGTQN